MVSTGVKSTDTFLSPFSHYRILDEFEIAGGLKITPKFLFATIACTQP
jgi:hypothetical protein